MALDRYWKKRDFSKTPEPAGKRRRTTGRLRFVVQKHDAKRLHYDFRLELDGVLKSWAVPKGPSLDPAQKRLAVEVEDHPIEYAGFEGVIPAGQYGGGTVLVWDQGTWTPEKDPVRGLTSGKLEFRLAGSKLKGSWALVRMARRASEEKNNWLLIKRSDDEARSERKFDVTRDEPDSIVTGRDLATVAATRDRVWTSKGAPRDERTTKAKSAKRVTRAPTRKAAAPARRVSRSPRPSARVSTSNAKKARANRARSTVDPSTIEGARRAALPQWVEPQLATLVRAAPPGDEWLHETKFDGYRALCRIANGRARWLTRNGNDWTSKFAALSPALERLPVEEALLDGEVVVMRPDGTTSFQDLQNAFRGGASSFTYCAFDLLHLDGFDLRPAPLHARKSALERLLAGNGSPSLRYSDHLQGSGEEMYRAACRHRLEGIISKRRDEPYRSGRGLAWVKTKCSLEQEFVIGGFSPPAGTRQHFGALLLGYYAGKALRYAGRVGTGFDARTLKTVRAKLARLERKALPFADPPTGADARGVLWVKPELVAAVQFTGWTEEGLLRHPSFLGLREDKPAREVVREKPVAAPRRNGARPRRGSRKGRA